MDPAPIPLRSPSAHHDQVANSFFLLLTASLINGRHSKNCMNLFCVKMDGFEHTHVNTDP